MFCWQRSSCFFAIDGRRLAVRISHDDDVGCFVAVFLHDDKKADLAAVSGTQMNDNNDTTV